MLESYITPMLMSYISKYVKNIKPSDLQVSFWGGDAVLRNLELRLDVLERELRYPLEIKSGHIRELVLHIPWNAILSKPVEAVIKDVEIVIKLKDVRNVPASCDPSQAPPQSSAPAPVPSDAGKEGMEQGQPGYLQGYTSRILHNLTFHVQNLVVKVIEEECDMVMSFNVQAINFSMANERWESDYVYTDYSQGEYILNKVLEISDMVVYLQAIENDRINKELPQEPFVKKCSFACRMQSQYNGKKLLKHSTNLLFDDLDFSANEKQFTLFLHLLDWLLAMYYSGKRLKGRDDSPDSGHTTQLPLRRSSDAEGVSLPARESTGVAADAVSNFEDVLLSGSVGDVESLATRPQGGGEGGEGGGGWGSWVWSFVGAEEGEGEGREGGEGEGREGEGREGGEGEGPVMKGEGKESVLPELSSFAIMAKSITVHMKVTHQGQVPVFYSLKSPSRSVLHVEFSGCSVRVDSVPSTQLFAMSIGIMAMQAAVGGLCSCIKKLPSSWKANSDTHEVKVPVFSLGETNSCDTELIIANSLFDLTPSTVDQLPPPPAEHLLAPRPEFSAVWFTYEYYDVGPAHSIEVCTERLEVGEMDVLLGPDVTHRLTHFTAAYRGSLQACPLFSEGMVVIGDPKAETVFKINVAGVRVVVTSNTHYLTSSPSDHKKSKTPNKQSSSAHFHSPPPLLPALSITLARSTVNITSAMYSGNASTDSPQRRQIRADFCQVEVADLDNFISFTLNGSLSTQLNKVVSVPKFEVYQHSKLTGEATQENTSYVQLDLEELSCALSSEQTAKLLYVYASWSNTAKFSDSVPKFDLPSLPDNLGHLHVSVKEATLTKSVETEFSLLSVVLSSCSVVLLRDSTTGRLCHALPVLCGPVATEQWNTAEVYSRAGLRPQSSSAGRERLVEFFTATPNDGHSGDRYPTVQLSVGGMGVCLDPALLAFVKHVPFEALRALQKEEATNPETLASKEYTPAHSNTSCPQTGVLNRQISAQSITTAEGHTQSTAGATDDPTNEGGFMATLKSYATKVDIKPILIVVPATSLEEDLTSALLPEFPVLPALHADSPTAAATEAVLLSLPHLSLRSAKSHVLDEPVPKDTTVSTLPWNSTLHHACVIAVQNGSARYVVEPLAVTVSLAGQQGGTGVTVHADTVGVALSREQGSLVSVCASSVLEALSPFLTQPPSEEDEDSGIHSTPLTPHHLPPTPSLLSSPAHSTVTTATVTTLPAHTSHSTTSASSLITHHSFSALWIQAIITKITLTLFARLPKLPPQNHNQNERGRSSTAQGFSVSSSTGFYATPLTSPTECAYTRDTATATSGPLFGEGVTQGEGPAENGAQGGGNFATMANKGIQENKQKPFRSGSVPPATDVGQTGTNNRSASNSCFKTRTELVKFALDIDGVSVQLDVQEKCTDLVLKVSSVDASLYRKQGEGKKSSSGVAQDSGGGGWGPYLPSETILSSKGSALPESLSQLLVHSSPAAVQLPTSVHGHSISSAFRNFVTLEMSVPRSSPHRATRLQVKVQSFEAVAWLPVVNLVSTVLSSVALGHGKEEAQKKEVYVSSRPEPREAGSWPAIEANVECFRLVLPSADYSNTLLCNVGGVVISNSLDYPTTDVRYVVSASAFRRLAHLSSDRKQPPLPAYQVDACSVSVWGVRREEGESGQVLLYAGSSDVRLVYTPALYWLPTDTGASYTRHRPAILACGHCVEVNFRTDLSLILGPEQVDCVLSVLQSNTLSQSTDEKTESAIILKTGLPISAPAPQTVPFKALVSGNTIGLTLVSNCRDEAMVGVDTASESSDLVFSTLHGLEATIVPLVQVQLFNPLCSVCYGNAGYKYEGSCFNMAVSYSDDAGLCGYSDLVEAGMASSLLTSPLLETRRGQPLNSRHIPPSVVSLSWETSHCKPPVLMVDVSRPVKLTLTSQLITKVAEFNDAILKAVRRREKSEQRFEEAEEHCKSNLDIRREGEEVVQKQQDPRVGESFSSNVNATRKRKPNKEVVKPELRGASTKLDGSSEMRTQIKLSSTQAVVEFQLTSRTREEVSSRGDGESFVSLEGEMMSQSRAAISATEEGLVVVWDQLTLAYPNVSSKVTTQSTAVTGDIHVNGLQLLSIMDCATSSILLPTQLNCFLFQHIPTSAIDLPYATVNISCGLLEAVLSRSVVDLAHRVLQTVRDAIVREERGEGRQGDAVRGAIVREERGEGRQGEAVPGDYLKGVESGVEREGPTEEVVHFRDDLRTGDFVYVTDSEVVSGYIPSPGEIFFSQGTEDNVTSMSWHYREPRALTKLAFLPVPFSFTSEEDTPIDIKVGCTLDYWDEDRDMFSALEEFRLSETTPTEVVVSRVIGSRKWRIAIVEVEWVDDEEGERFVSRADLVDEEGAPVPIASILSPVSLAGCTCVDSYFSPQFIPHSDLSLTCHGVQVTLVHTPQNSGWFGDYEVTSLTGSRQELARLNVQHLTCHLKQMRNNDTALQIDGRPTVEFIDFVDLTWRTALHPTHLNARLERKTRQVEPSQPRTVAASYDMSASLNCSPAVVRLSQGLLHTTTLAVHAWSTKGETGREGERESEAEKKAVILNHFILCNDTMQDIHFGQVSTDEVELLRSRHCIGYSWRNHKKTPQTLHLCLVTDGVWRWTKPFSIVEEGTQSIEVYIGRNSALVNVCTTSIGGLQRQVTLTGSWKFCSTLPFPLHLALVPPAHHHDDHNDHEREDSSSCTETSFESREIFLLPPDSSLASLVVPDSCLAGVRVKSPQSLTWSEVYPIHSATDDWNKPQLLTEMEYASGQRVNLWYNINPMHTSKHGDLGSKITFSPLFAVCNHLPFDLTMVSTVTDAAGPAHSLPECVVKGEGERVSLCGLQADTWYHLAFKQNSDGGGGGGELSKPSVSLSTFLLVHLPFSTQAKQQQQQLQKWPYEDDDSDVLEAEEGTSTSIKVRLPLDNGTSCSLHAILERNPTNTVTLHLQPDVIVINRCPVPIRVLTTLQEREDEGEGGMELDIESPLNPNNVSIIPQSKFSLLIDWEGKTLSSQPLIAHPDQKKGETSDSTNVILTERDSFESCRVFSNLTLIWRHKGSMVVISIVPSYVFYNNTSHDLHVSAYLFHRESHGLLVEPSLISELVASQDVKPILFWEHREYRDLGPETVLALLLRNVGEGKLWSLPLSPDFVRHSFALPTSSELFTEAVLTMHDHACSVYMVVAEDPSPRLLVQNLTQQNLETVEEGTQGIHACAQPIPPSQQVTYEPPTFAKQYPMVFDEEIAQAREKEMKRSLKLVSVKFRLSQSVQDGDEEQMSERDVGEWSEPFSLNSDSDRILSIPGGESIFISTHRKGATLYLTLLPTGQAAPPQPLPLANSSRETGAKTGLSMDVKLTELVVCLDDETAGDPKAIQEVLQIIADGLVLQYSSLGDGISLEFTVESLHVNNMTEGETADFAVTVIPREEHLKRASLIESIPTPLARLSVHYNPNTPNLIDSLHVAVQPLTLQLEDGLLDRLKLVFQSYGVPGVLLIKPTTSRNSRESCSVPDAVRIESNRDVSPLAITRLVIDSGAFYLNARISFKVLLSCNDSPFRFAHYELENVYSNWTEVSQTIGSRYIMSTIAHIGWLLGSLELIGSPGTFIQNVGRGLRDLVTLPYEGLTRSPGWFLLGIGHGTMSFVHHLSSGALRSVTSMASSISRNMERLSMDPHHISYQDQQRQERPATHFTVGLVSGASSFGLSLMSAVAGIVEQPMQSFHQMEGPTSPTLAARSILKGVGKGLIGVVTKPVGGAMELVSQTGQGIMHGTGLAHRLCHRTVELHAFTGTIQRAELQPSSTSCAIKLGGENMLLLSTPVKYFTKTGSQYVATLLLTPEKIFLLDSDSNTFQQNFAISDYSLEERVSGTSGIEEVEIHIVAKSQRAETPKFHQVEYFLQLSHDQEGKTGGLALPSSSLHISESDKETELEAGSEEGDTDTGVKLLVAIHHAAQLLSLCNSLSQLFGDADAAFCVHRTRKSESFFTAISN